MVENHKYIFMLKYVQTCSTGLIAFVVVTRNTPKDAQRHSLFKPSQIWVSKSKQIPLTPKFYFLSLRHRVSIFRIMKPFPLFRGKCFCNFAPYLLIHEAIEGANGDSLNVMINGVKQSVEEIINLNRELNPDRQELAPFIYYICRILLLPSKSASIRGVR